ncbi:hypothetical protein GALMADRAFT_216868 [Galerina marginata CBS 339.88]|uniref:Uncharacterized protein n=1 Tax=Galerina marginata (strain CBS 339.88) TaxID=685588 RepID=A0A067SIQ7_GALM3|nr:hypothetical protein GALMADRAFT_216868 [Galerina marginata CBS 339.88]
MYTFNKESVQREQPERDYHEYHEYHYPSQLPSPQSSRPSSRTIPPSWHVRDEELITSSSSTVPKLLAGVNNSFNPVSLPTPRQSLDEKAPFHSPSPTPTQGQGPSKDTNLNTIKLELSKRAPNETTYNDVTLETFHQLQADLENGQLTGSENASIDYDAPARFMVVKFPTIVHEILVQVLGHKDTTKRSNLTEEYATYYGGSPSIHLGEAGSKSPDQSIFDEYQSGSLADVFPTVTFEVGFSESTQKLNNDAVRTLGGTGGRVKLVITLKIEMFRTENEVRGGLRYITGGFWEVEKTIEDDEGRIGEQLHTPYLRVDSDDERPVYEFTTGEIGKKTWTYLIRRTKKFQVFPVVDAQGVLEILGCHVFRRREKKPLPEDVSNSVYISIPFSAILNITLKNLKKQVIVDNTRREKRALSPDDEIVTEAKRQRKGVVNVPDNPSDLHPRPYPTSIIASSLAVTKLPTMIWSTFVQSWLAQGAIWVKTSKAAIESRRGRWQNGQLWMLMTCLTCLEVEERVAWIRFDLDK